MGAILHRERAAGCDPRLAQLLDAWAERLGFSILVLSGRRTQAEQAALYAKGRTAPGPIVTNAPSAATSAHGHAAAIDAMPLDDHGHLVWDTPETMARVRAMAVVAEELGLEWGGRWKTFPDYDHFQCPNWKTLPLAG
jgi:peptidoglycan L-alanyl-D-glutamate endopeptidase CwlK